MARAARATRGVVVAFDTDRGFGFIRSKAHGEDVFVHVSAIRAPGGERTLRAGQRVLFEAEPAERGPRAVWVEGRAGSVVELTPGQAAMGGLLAAVGLLAVGLWWFGGVPGLAAYLMALNLATLGAYALDKHRATRDGRRVPEAALLGLALAGGSPAAALGMALLRHKTRKGSFLAAIGAILVVHGLALAAWMISG